MKFKIDENLPLEIAKLLTDEGYNAETVGDQGLRGAKDSILIEICKKEDRILVTLDTDFSNIRAYPAEELAGVIVLKIKSQGKNHVMKVENTQWRTSRRKFVLPNMKSFSEVVGGKRYGNDRENNR